MRHQSATNNSQHYSRRALYIALGLIGLSTSHVWAACDNTAPTSGATVSCTPSAGTSPSVIAVANSSNVNVTVDPGTISFTRMGIQVVGSSSVTNNGALTTIAGSGSGLKAAISALTNNNTITNSGTGTISVTGANIYGISIGTSAAGGGGTNNTVNNAGTITTLNSSSDAIHVVGGNNTITNSGAITTSGTSSTAVYAQGNTNSFTNTSSGTINVSGNGSDGVFMNTVSSTFTSTITNNGSITSVNSYAIRGLNGSDTVINSGTLKGAGGVNNDTAIILGNSLNNVLILQTGSHIVGAADGGSGNSNVYLEGTGTVDNAFRNFNTLTMRGTDWTWETDATFNNTLIQSGILRLDSVLTSPVYIGAGGTLTTGNLAGVTVASTAAGAGTGTVVGVLSGLGTVAGNLTNGGTVHPGAGDGTGAITIAGNYTNLSSGTLVVDVSSTSASQLIVNSGSTVNLQGGQVIANFQAGNYDAGFQREIIKCTGSCVTGAFSVYTPSAFIDTTVFNGAGNQGVFIGYKRNDVSFADIATTDNDKALAASLDANAKAGGMTNTVDQLVAMSAAQAQSAFSNLGGGDVHATLAGLNMRQGDIFARALTQRLSGRLPRDTARDSALWARPYYTSGQVDSDVVASASYGVNGLAAGMDRWINSDWLFGAGVDVSQMRSNFSAYDAHAKTDAYQVGLYSSYQHDRFYLDGIASVGWQKNTVNRSINFNNVVSQANADYTGRHINLYVETGYQLPLSTGLILKPLASLSYVRQREPGFVENGAGEIGLNGESATTQSLRSGLGATLTKDFALSRGVLTVEGKARWLHEFEDRTPQFQAAFIGDVTGQRFTVQGAQGWRDAALLGVNLVYAQAANMHVYLSYDATVAKRDTAHTITAGLRYAW
ncbi:autotransporter outer membrane beta-barrel domain-containing protein [Herminiimonas arsenitoxidans]|uniref:autotransporter outer membrane beta-barrel domain-containing protein n=1 Tax=Herminiimonas arsenitoxidans TaxID=1809410 RepID=UPI001E2912FE|nr:autotransporter domain-containing protein [Herminiimonas arsenitoxidans]